MQGYSVNDQAVSSPPTDGDGPADRGEVGSNSPFLGIPEPNPSRDGFSLEFGLAEADWVEVSMYDVKGRQVDRLVNTFVSGGQHRVQWQPGENGAPAISPGLYFLRMVTTARVHTQKVMIVE
jgi:hypothetical protein